MSSRCTRNSNLPSRPMRTFPTTTTTTNQQTTLETSRFNWTRKAFTPLTSSSSSSSSYRTSMSWTVRHLRTVFRILPRHSLNLSPSTSTNTPLHNPNCFITNNSKSWVRRPFNNSPNSKHHSKPHQSRRTRSMCRPRSRKALQTTLSSTKMCQGTFTQTAARSTLTATVLSLSVLLRRNRWRRVEAS